MNDTADHIPPAIARLMPWTHEDAMRAHEEWGANCGPAALAFFLRRPIDAVRRSIPEFERRGYVSITMMRDALERECFVFDEIAPAMREQMFRREPALVRIQFEGPWAMPGMKPARWASSHTHWIATALLPGGVRLVVDVNGGPWPFSEWEDVVVPALTERHKRSTGGWRPTHILRSFVPLRPIGETGLDPTARPVPIFASRPRCAGVGA